MLIDNTTWNLSLIVDWLSDLEIEAILSSRYRPSTRSDKWVWCNGISHIYTVKEGYKVAHGVILRENDRPCTSSQTPLKPVWKAIWKLKVSRKIRLFIWKIFYNALPTFENLFKRKCSKENHYLICKSNSESLSHLFCLCPWVNRVWFASSFTFQIPITADFNFQQWLMDLDQVKPQWLGKVFPLHLTLADLETKEWFCL